MIAERMETARRRAWHGADAEVQLPDTAEDRRDRREQGIG